MYVGLENAQISNAIKYILLYFNLYPIRGTFGGIVSIFFINSCIASFLYIYNDAFTNEKSYLMVNGINENETLQFYCGAIYGCQLTTCDKVSEFGYNETISVNKINKCNLIVKAITIIDFDIRKYALAINNEYMKDNEDDDYLMYLPLLEPQTLTSVVIRKNVDSTRKDMIINWSIVDLHSFNLYKECQNTTINYQQNNKSKVICGGYDIILDNQVYTISKEIEFNYAIKFTTLIGLFIMFYFSYYFLVVLNDYYTDISVISKQIIKNEINI